MSTLAGVLLGGVFGLAWLYVAARVITRGIMRTIRERRTEHGQKSVKT